MANINYTNAANTTVVRDLRKVDAPTQNIYESLAIISKRANQVNSQIKEEYQGRLL